MSDHDPIDRLLDEAFRSRPIPSDTRPSMIDVHRRARRRHHRRTGATLGAVALVGVGGAVAFAMRSDGRDQLTAGEGDLGTPTTYVCDTTTLVASTVPGATLPPFDTTTTSVPAAAGAPPTTIFAWPTSYPCAPTGWTWHCTGELGSDEFGRAVYESCEQVGDGSFATTTVPVSTVLEPSPTSTTITEVSVNGNVDQTTTTSQLSEPTTTSIGG